MKVMDWSTLIVTYRLLGGVSWDYYVTTDDRALTTDTAGDDWEAVIVTQARGELEEYDDDVDDIGDDEPETPVITARDALLRIKNIVGFVCCGCKQCTSTGISYDRAELAAGTLHQAGCPCRADNHH